MVKRLENHQLVKIRVWTGPDRGSLYEIYNFLIRNKGLAADEKGAKSIHPSRSHAWLEHEALKEGQ